MPTNKQRRTTAQRKLERQLERRAQRARMRRRGAIIAVSVVAIAAVAAVVGFVVMKRSDDTQTASDTTTPPTADVDNYLGLLPLFTPPPGLGADCQYPPAAPAAKPVNPPRTGQVHVDPEQVSVSMMTDQGPIGIQLLNGRAPCTVNNFVSLAQQGFFNDTRCHRLTTSPKLGVLQCGDPTGAGQGGPGYQFANEYPTNQYAPDDPAAKAPILYPKGTLAMANAGANTNGSQFFLVYKDSELPPQYTIFGKIDDTGLATLDKIAQAGVGGGGEDGQPATPVTITSVQLD